MSVKEKSLGLVAILAIAIAGFAVLGSVTYWNKLTALHAHELAAARAQNEQRVQQLTEAAAQQFDGTVRSVDTARCICATCTPKTALVSSAPCALC
jgi:hypothetical protein